MKHIGTNFKGINCMFVFVQILIVIETDDYLLIIGGMGLLSRDVISPTLPPIVTCVHITV